MVGESYWTLKCDFLERFADRTITEDLADRIA